MCLPALGLIGGIISGIGAMAQASAQAATHDANAQLQERQNQIQIMSGAYKAQAKERENKIAAGEQRAAFASNGIALSGTPSLVIQESVEEGALDVQAIRWGARLEGDNSLYQKEIELMNKKAAKTAGIIGFLTPIVGALGQGFG
jgi:hypothetical protein